MNYITNAPNKQDLFFRFFKDSYRINKIQANAKSGSWIYTTQKILFDKPNNFTRIAINSKYFKNAFIVDCDHDDYFDWFGRVPMPTYTIKNKINDKHHHIWLLKDPIPIFSEKNGQIAKESLMQYIENIQNGLTLAVGGDTDNRGFISKNPLNTELFEVILWDGSMPLYALKELAGTAIKGQKHTNNLKSRVNENTIAIGRNCRIFEFTRLESYKLPKEISNNQNVLSNAVEKIALSYNAQEEEPLLIKEVQGIAKSITNYIFNRKAHYISNRKISTIEEKRLNRIRGQRRRRDREVELIEKRYRFYTVLAIGSHLYRSQKPIKLRTIGKNNNIYEYKSPPSSKCALGSEGRRPERDKSAKRVLRRQINLRSDQCFVDTSGLTLPVCDPLTGEVRNVEIFVGVLGKSGYPFARAIPLRSKKEFFAVHHAMFEVFGGAPKVLVTNKLKFVIVRKGKNKGKTDPDYERFADHNGCVVMPTEPIKSKDVPLVKGGIGFIQKWIFSKLHSETFFSITQLNKAIDELLAIYHNKVIKRYGQSRQEMFDAIDKPELKTLPLEPYEHNELKLLKVGIDSHIILNNCLYSVPYRLIGEKVEVEYTSHAVIVRHEDTIVATHLRLTRKGTYSTKAEHMGSTYQIYQKWSPGRILNWGLTIGKETSELLRHILERDTCPEMGYRACFGLMSEFKKYSAKGLNTKKLDSIAKYAVTHHRFRLKQIRELIEYEVKIGTHSLISL